MEEKKLRKKIKKKILKLFEGKKDLQITLDDILQNKDFQEFPSEIVAKTLDLMQEGEILARNPDNSYVLNLLNKETKKTRLKYSQEDGFYTTEKITKTKIKIPEVPDYVNAGDYVKIRILAEKDNEFLGEITKVVTKKNLPSKKKIRAYILSAFDEQKPLQVITKKKIYEHLKQNHGIILPEPLLEEYLQLLVRGNFLVNIEKNKYQLSLIGQKLPAIIRKNKRSVVAMLEKFPKVKVSLISPPKQVADGEKVQIRIKKQTKKGLEGVIIAVSSEVSQALEKQIPAIVTELTRKKVTLKVKDKLVKTLVKFVEAPLPSFDLQINDRVLISLQRIKKVTRNGNTKVIAKGKILTKIRYDDIITEFGLPKGFPEEVLRELQKLPKELSKEEIASRLDFREVLTFTIDPEDAKDFDDALSFRVLKKGVYEVGVHIADVSYYVKKDTATDKEAYKRSTSVYLPDGVIPMLPEVLSNDLCSLRPEEERFAFSAIFQLTETGEILREKFAKTIIRSDRRFTYEEAQELIENPRKGDKFSEAIQILNTIARKFRSERFNEGSVLLASDEVKIILDEEGKVKEIKKRIMREANELIEDFMLLANRRVARFLSGKLGAMQKIPALVFRVHGEPKQEKLADFDKLLKAFGIRSNILRLQGQELAKEINDIIKTLKTKDPTTAELVATLAVRAMAKAEYSTENIGHFGLGFDYYTHFTSPIRRYPDLIVHRILEAVLHKEKLPYTYRELVAISEHTSKQEVRAVQAEREAVKAKLAEYMSRFIGEEFTGVISGISHHGVFIKIPDIGAEGLLHYREFDEPVYPIPEKMAIRLKHSAEEWQLGDEIQVVVKKVNLQKREIDFALPDYEE